MNDPRQRITYAAILFLLSVWSCAAIPLRAAEVRSSDPQSVSMINLIATPERFDKKFVEVTGWASIHPESKSLCLSRSVLSTVDCVWIDYDLIEAASDTETLKRKKQRVREEINQKVVIIHGTFVADKKGHLGMWSGTITNVRSMAVVVDNRPRRIELNK